MLNKRRKSKKEYVDYEFLSDLKNQPILSSVEENDTILSNMFADCVDFVNKKFQLKNGTQAMATYIDGLTSSDHLEKLISLLMLIEEDKPIQTLQQFISQRIPSTQLKSFDNYGEMLVNMLSGDVCIFLESQKEVIIIDYKFPNLPLQEPQNESGIRGPREAFVENLRLKTSTLRRKIKTPHLKMKNMVIGKHSNTNIVLSYMDNIADKSILKEVIRRIEKIEIDAIFDSGYIEELIMDSNVTPFPLAMVTERPDTTAACLLEGRIAIMVDGSPSVMIVPMTFNMVLNASDDYYEPYMYVAMKRFLRYFFFGFALVTPSLYVAIITFHQDLMPTTLLLSIASSREFIPFPAVLEVLLMEIVFEVLREASIRIPKTIGQTAVSILGALVVGQAAVEAGIVSAPVVIVVSITGISALLVPQFNGAVALRILRFPLIIFASMFGIIGIIFFIMIIIGHMASLRSFGVPYLAPFTPLTWSDLKDTFVRAPWPLMRKRPHMIPNQDEIRESKTLEQIYLHHGGQKNKPSPPSSSSKEDDSS
ncbi:spore germination protein [Longirhabdus pacifica]|uniref:spore germination protein n=1 Tax=Longirhabdus pacifica TaxID=2305227 RepID=UPI0013E89C74|nr:spore germination protein [Longirhabdus pacifica]